MGLEVRLREVNKSMSTEEMKAESTEHSRERFGNEGRERALESSKAKCRVLQSRQSFVGRREDAQEGGDISGDWEDEQRPRETGRDGLEEGGLGEAGGGAPDPGGGRPWAKRRTPFWKWPR